MKLDAPDLDTGSDTEVNTTSESGHLGSQPPDVVRDSNTSASPELLSDISSPTLDSPPVPAPRRKNNSFRITASNINLSRPKVITIGRNSNENQLNNAAPVLPLRKTKSSKNRSSKKNSPPLSPLEEKFLQLRLKDKQSKREKFFNDMSNRSSPTNKSDLSAYATPLASPSTTPDNPLQSISHLVDKVNTTPNSEKCIKSILVSKLDKKVASAKDKTSPHHSKDCIVM